MFLIFLLLGSTCFAQLSTNWTIPGNQIVFLPNTNINCSKSDHATIDNVNGWLVITGEVLAQPATCYDRNLNGTIRNGPTSYAGASSLLWTTSFNFTYGTIEYRAKLPVVAGSWPAIWLLGSNTGVMGQLSCQGTYIFTTDNVGGCVWPVPPSDEIDLSERLGSATDSLNVHGTGACASLFSAWASGDTVPTWHTYSVVWSAGSLIKSVDGNVVASITSSCVPSDPQFILIDMLMGGFGGTVNPAQWPQQMTVDYIKVTQGSTVIFDEEFNGVNGTSMSGSAQATGKVVIQ